MSLEQITQSLGKSDTDVFELASKLAKKARNMASDIDSQYCKELNRGFSRDLVNKLKISSKVLITNAKLLGGQRKASICC